jgi:hypothetical protein
MSEHAGERRASAQEKDERRKEGAVGSLVGALDALGSLREGFMVLYWGGGRGGGRGSGRGGRRSQAWQHGSTAVLGRRHSCTRRARDRRGGGGGGQSRLRLRLAARHVLCSGRPRTGERGVRAFLAGSERAQKPRVGGAPEKKKRDFWQAGRSVGVWLRASTWSMEMREGCLTGAVLPIGLHAGERTQKPAQ